MRVQFVPSLRLLYVQQSVNQATAPVLPLLLSSKALPEMEAERTELLQMHGMAAGAASAPERFQSLTVRARAHSA